MSIIKPFDRETLRASYQSARPFPHMVIDDFLAPDAAAAAASSYFSFEEARTRGFEFKAVNENLKIQIVDQTSFRRPSPNWLMRCRARSSSASLRTSRVSTT
jgi:hypothetical protein